MNTEYDYKYLKSMADRTRYNIVAMMSHAGSGHPGGSLSAVEILSVLYYGKIIFYDSKNIKMDNRDRFIMSKGHASPTLYAILADLGFFPKAWLRDFDRSGSNLPKHCDRFKTPGIEASTGALGQGFAIAVGEALAERIDKSNYNIYCLIGDGECQSGNLWEAVMAAGKYKLDNLKVIIDNNGLQIDGFTDDVMPLGDIRKIWEGFGWHVEECDGHNIQQLTETFEKIKGVKDKPQVIIANTIKGKGVSFMENDVNWHSQKISMAQAKMALEELDHDLNESCLPVGDFLREEELQSLYRGEAV